jgi:hypothetical protein
MYIDRPFEWVPVPQTEPTTFFASSARAEHIPSPGATKSGFILPSSVGPSEESVLTVPFTLDPIERTFFAVPGAVIFDAPVPPLSPTEKIGRRYLLFETY